MPAADAARAATARRRVKRAAGLLREAAADLAALSAGADTLAVARVESDDDAREVLALLRRERARRDGPLDVVILAVPDGAPHGRSMTGEGEQHGTGPQSPRSGPRT